MKNLKYKLMLNKVKTLKGGKELIAAFNGKPPAHMLNRVLRRAGYIYVKDGDGRKFVKVYERAKA